MKKVSVVIPVYGVEKYIASAVQSVLDQTYKNFELLIVDDGSPDRSVEIVQQFEDPRIRIIRQENQGLAGARNTGIRNTQGEYLAFLDGDDIWVPEKLSKHVKHLEDSPTVGVSFSRSVFIDEMGNSLNTYLMPKLKDITSAYLLHCNPVGNGSAAVFRRETLESIKFPDNRYGPVEDFYFDDRFYLSQDIECWLRISIQTPWQFEGLPEALTLYRVNSLGLSMNFLQKVEYWEKILEKTRSYAPELIDQWGNSSRAYHLRYLARSAVRLKDGSIAVKLINQALVNHWRIVLEEPSRTLRILLAAYLLRLIPRSAYSSLESVAANVAGAIQRRRINAQLKQPRTQTELVPPLSVECGGEAPAKSV